MELFEKVINTGLYGGANIHLTNLNHFYVETCDGSCYPVDSLQAAKDMIDELNKTRRN